jgi:hypothetical protein
MTVLVPDIGLATAITPFFAGVGFLVVLWEPPKSMPPPATPAARSTTAAAIASAVPCLRHRDFFDGVSSSVGSSVGLIVSGIVLSPLFLVADFYRLLYI